MLVSLRITGSKSDDLNEQLDWLTVDHDDLRRDIFERIATPKYHPSMAVIDRWEEESIAQIRHSTVLARRALIDALDEHVLKVEKILNTLTPKLSDARNGVQSFNKNDIQEWAATLYELKQIPTFPIMIDTKTLLHGLIIDLRKEERIQFIDSTTSHCLISTLRDPITSASNVPRKTEPDNKEVRIQRAYSEIPFDSRTTYPLRGPATVYH